MDTIKNLIDGISKIRYEAHIPIHPRHDDLDTNEIARVYRDITNVFTGTNREFERFRGYIVIAISTNLPDRDKVVKYMEVCNQIIANSDEYNSLFIQRILRDDNPSTRTKFTTKYNIRVKDISTIKLPGYNVPWLRERKKI